MKMKGIFSASNRSAMAKLFFAGQTDIEQREIRSAVGNQVERSRHISRGSPLPSPRSQECVLEVERD